MASDDGGSLWAKSGDEEIPPLRMRDYFAANAMVATVRSEDGLFHEGLEPWKKGATETLSEKRQKQLERIAKDSYAIADAMLLERARGKERI